MATGTRSYDDSGEGMFEQSIATESNSGIDEGLLSDMGSDCADRESLKMLHDINFSQLVERNTYSGFMFGARDNGKDLTSCLIDGASGVKKAEEETRKLPLKADDYNNEWVRGNQALI